MKEPLKGDDRTHDIGKVVALDERLDDRSPAIGAEALGKQAVWNRHYLGHNAWTFGLLGLHKESL